MVVVGLGNPGEQYNGTRHNLGAVFVEYVRQRELFPEWSRDQLLKADIARGMLRSVPCTLVRPTTFMNESGDAVRRVLGAITPKHLVIAHDDVDLPFGVLRISFDRGAGGHNGVKSVEEHLHTKAFVRFRFGIMPNLPSGASKKPSSHEAISRFVLSPFSSWENDMLPTTYERALDALVLLSLKGLSEAMSFGNTSARSVRAQAPSITRDSP